MNIYSADPFTDIERANLNEVFWGFYELNGGFNEEAKPKPKEPKQDSRLGGYTFYYKGKEGQYFSAIPKKGQKNELTTDDKIRDFLSLDSAIFNFASFGGFLRADYCTIDFDKAESVEKFKEIFQKGSLPNIPIRQTKKGFHCDFKIPEELKSEFRNLVQTTNVLLACGLIADIRCSKYIKEKGSYSGSGSYITLKLNAKYRKYIQTVDEIPELPPYFYPIYNENQEGKKVKNLIDMKHGDGRNNELLKHRSQLERNYFNFQQVEETILFINNNIFAEPMPLEELYSTNVLKEKSSNSSTYSPSIYKLRDNREILLDDLEEEEERLLKVLLEFKGAKLYQKLGFYIVNKFHIIKCPHKNEKGIVYQYFFYDNGIYSPLDEENIKSHINKINPFSKNQIAEIVEKVKLSAVIYEKEKDNTNLQPYKNGYINLEEANSWEEVKTLKVHPYTPEIKFFFKIPFNWNPAILENIEVKDIVDKFISDIACGQQEYITKLFEFGAISLWRSSQTIYKKAFFLTGKGANGKSTYIEFVTYCIGESNTSKVSPYYLSDKFRQGILQNKLLNFDDDIGYKRFQAEPLKKAVTGNELTCEAKFKDPFKFRPYCSFIYGCNSIPNNDDFTSSMERRLVIIEFNADFSKSSKSRDVNFSDKIQNPKMAEYFLVRSVEYLKKILLNGGNMEESPLCDNSVDEYISSSSPVIGFLRNWINDRKDDYIKDSSYNPKYPLQDVRLDDLYNEYKEYCRNDNRRESNDLYKGNFSKEICREANCKTKRKTKNGRKETYFYYPQIETIEEAIDEEYSPF